MLTYPPLCVCVCVCLNVWVSREIYFELVFLKINNFWLIKFVIWQFYIIHPDPYPTFFISRSLSTPTFLTGLFPTSMSWFCLWPTEINLDCLYDHEFETMYWSLVVLLVGTQLKTMAPSPLASILRQTSFSSEVLGPYELFSHPRLTPTVHLFPTRCAVVKLFLC